MCVYSFKHAGPSHELSIISLWPSLWTLSQCFLANSSYTGLGLFNWSLRCQIVVGGDCFDYTVHHHWGLWVCTMFSFSICPDGNHFVTWQTWMMVLRWISFAGFKATVWCNRPIKVRHWRKKQNYSNHLPSSLNCFLHLIVWNEAWGVRYRLEWLCMDQRCWALWFRINHMVHGRFLCYELQAWTNLCFSLIASYCIVEVALKVSSINWLFTEKQGLTNVCKHVKSFLSYWSYIMVSRPLV